MPYQASVRSFVNYLIAHSTHQDFVYRCNTHRRMEVSVWQRRRSRSNRSSMPSHREADQSPSLKANHHSASYGRSMKSVKYADMHPLQPMQLNPFLLQQPSQWHHRDVRSPSAHPYHQPRHRKMLFQPSALNKDTSCVYASSTPSRHSHPLMV